MIDIDIIDWILRICVCMTFFGHGYLATKIQSSWYSYLRVVGIGRVWGTPLMRVIGVMDIILSLACLFTPHLLLFLWCFVWGLATALMRPLAGESLCQFIERSGNFLPSLVLSYIYLQSPSSPLTLQESCFLTLGVLKVMMTGGLFLRKTGWLAREEEEEKTSKKK